VSEGQVLVLGLVVDEDLAGLLAFVLHLHAQAFKVLFNEHLLRFDLHVSHGVTLRFNVAVDDPCGLE